MKRSRLAAFGLAVGIASMGPAFADPPGGVPPGLAKKGVDAREWQDRKGDRHGGHDRDARHDRDDRHHRDGRVIVVERPVVRDRVIVIGQPMPRRPDYVIVRDYDRYRVPPPPRGYSYYQADGQLWQVADATSKVAEALGAVSALLR